MVLHLIIASPQINLHLTDWVSNEDNDHILQHDCLHVAASNEDTKDPHQVISYCLSDWPLKWNIKKNSQDQEFTFAELLKRNITSQQLYLWSAPMDVIENYQFYLNQLSTSNATLMATKSYYNCTQPRFGPLCQYSLDGQYSHHSSLNEIIQDFYFNNTYTPTDLTCYTHLECDLGSTLLCLDWSDICDGLIHCIGGMDEEQCWQLEINKCKDNEYRCENGQCISLAFLNDDIHAPECLDRSDEWDLLTVDQHKIINEPTFQYEDVTCPRRLHLYRPPFSISCNANRNHLIIQLMFSHRSNSTSDVCWSALKCYLQLPEFDPKCRDICERSVCQEIIQKDCPDQFFFPAVPVLFGHIYLAYKKEDIINTGGHWDVIQSVCYGEKLCQGFYLNRTLFSFNNMTCRRPQHFQTYYPGIWLRPLWVVSIIKPLYKELYKCNTIIRNDPIFCDNSTMYQCANSSKCIANTHLYNRVSDCDYNDDELFISTSDDCSINSSGTLFYCALLNRCIFRKQVADGTCDCGFDIYDICDDEHSAFDYIRKNVSFPTICDGFTELKPVLIKERFETDETECEQWPCINIYTRCDGVWNCFNGADEIDCHPLPIECPAHSHICVSRNTSSFICLPLGKVNDSKIDCLGAIDEPYLCRAISYRLENVGFYCNTGSPTHHCISYHSFCDRHNDCIHGDDEQFCSSFSSFGISHSICEKEYVSLHSNVEEFICRHHAGTEKPEIVHFTLRSIINSNNSIVKRDTSMASTHLPSAEILPPRQKRCHRGLNMRVWFDSEQKLTDITCLCPPSFYGSMCQYQSQRVSLTIQLRAFSDSWQIPFTLVISLIDDSDERIIHSYEQLTYLSMKDCQRKFNIYLLYSTRPKNQSKYYFVHIDFYEKMSRTYRGSVLLPIHFTFLPVYRLAVQLNIPRISDKSCLDQRCIHGKCIRYSEDPTGANFCQCDAGWSGQNCTIPYNCTCSSDALCIGILANNRPMCVCSINKWGSRCLLEDQVCQSNKNETCRNGGQCIPIHSYIASSKKFECICPKHFSGDTCEMPDNKIVLSFEKDIILPQTMLVHFIEAKYKASPENGATFRTIPLIENPVTVYWSRPFHIAFVELFTSDYYLIVVQKSYNRSMTITKTLQSSDRCLNIDEIFNETIAQSHLIHRIKYYHLPCQRPSLQLACFYDEMHICLCTEFGDQLHANCFEFKHNVTHDCFDRNTCENGAQCLQDSLTCPKTSICLCPLCFYGTQCQFSSEGFGLSLDAILGYHITPYISITQQSSIVQMSVALTVVMTIAGLVNSILSLITFNNEGLRKTGCGLYLQGSSIITLITMIIFAFKFWILLMAQITYMTNRPFLYFQCISFDFILRVGLNIDQWLNACVAMDRANTVLKGINFDQKKSKQIAKYAILALVILTVSTSIQDPFHRRLIDDGNDDDEKRIWCIVSYSRGFQLFNSIVNIFHFFVPFIINLLSAICIITATARRRTTAQHQQSYMKLLQEQFKEHRRLLVAPIILVILAVPRLIISFLSRCMNSSHDSWLFLAGYFLSYIPSVLTFIVFVLPSKTYKDEFYKSLKRYRRMLRARIHLIS